MKIMIPLSGGLDSSLVLYEALRDTTHEIVAVHYPENYTDVFRRTIQPHSTAIAAVTAWLRDNARSFEFRTGEIKTSGPDGVVFDYEETAPFYDGSLVRRNIYWMRCRYATHGHNAKVVEAEEIWLGSNMWNNKGVLKDFQRKTVALYSAAPLRRPLGNVGRMAIMSRLPVGLDDKILKCAESSPACARCLSCRSFSFYATVCRDKTAKQIEKVDQRLLEFARQDPGISPKKLKSDALNRSDWQAWLEAESLNDDDDTGDTE